MLDRKRPLAIYASGPKPGSKTDPEIKCRQPRSCSFYRRPELLVSQLKQRNRAFMNFATEQWPCSNDPYLATLQSVTQK